MRVFITGGGWVGSVVVKELIGKGHEVIGLARTPRTAASLQAAGAAVHEGSLGDLDSLRRGAGRADAVIHAAFDHDFSKFAANCEEDRLAIQAMGEALAGSDRPMIVTSGLLLVTAGPVATEVDPAVPPSPAYPRASEKTALELAAQGVRVGVVRLPPSVHGAGDHGFLTRMIEFARDARVSAYVGEGANRWSAVHRLDAARVFRLALERGGEGGPFHAVQDEGVPVRRIAETIGRRLGLPTVSISPEDAAQRFGPFAAFTQIDAATSSARTRAILGWAPEQADLLADLSQAHYFAP